MFGHDDDQVKTDTSNITTPTVQTVAPTTDTVAPTNTSSTLEPIDGIQPASLAGSSIVEPSKAETDSEESVTGAPDLTAPADTSPALDTSASTTPSEDPGPEHATETTDTVSSSSNTTPSLDSPKHAPSLSDLETTSSHATPGDGDDLNGLLAIKQDALGELSPLVDHLDQTADEKFHTTMMMIQASDDKSLIQKAFAAAKEITDDKERAQALLDIINEINYFTQHNSTEQ